MARRHLRAACPLLIALLGGCAHDIRSAPTVSSVGSTSYRSGTGKDLAHYELALGQIAMGAMPISHPAPVYPPAMLAACPASIELPARVIVGADGGVTEARINGAIDAAHAPFAPAVRRALQTWRFQPLQISRWAAAADGTSHEVDSDTRPFSLDYVFTFRCRQGRASVASGPVSATH